MTEGRDHRYEIEVTWTGNTGPGTASPAGYRRDHDVRAPGRPVIKASSDPAFRGDPERYNPEDLLLAALSECHMLAYLALCANSGVVVTGYADTAVGTMRETPDGGGHFTEVVLRPRVTVAEPGMVDRANRIHGAAHRRCFIASSVNFPVRHEPTAAAGPPGKADSLS